MSFWRNVSPGGAIRDLRDLLTAPSPHRWRFMLLAGMITTLLFMSVGLEQWRAAPRPPEIMYFPTLDPNRTDAQIIADNIKASRERLRADEEEEKRAEDVRQMYRAVGRATGVDVDTAYEQGKAEREAAKKKLEAEREATLKAHLAKQPAR